MGYQDTIKPHFQTGDFPTQVQFYQMFDYLRWKDELIDIPDLSPAIITILNSLRPERKTITAATGNNIDMAAEYKLVSLAIKNPSAFDLIFTLDYPAYTPPSPGDHWQYIEVPANSTLDLHINRTFWVATSLSLIEQTGVDFSATPVILLIDRK